jgi:hypothetical protein
MRTLTTKREEAADAADAADAAAAPAVRRPAIEGEESAGVGGVVEGEASHAVPMHRACAAQHLSTLTRVVAR